MERIEGILRIPRVANFADKAVSGSRDPGLRLGPALEDGTLITTKVMGGVVYRYQARDIALAYSTASQRARFSLLPGDEEVKLSGAEAAVLGQFMAHPHRVFTNTEVALAGLGVKEAGLNGTNLGQYARVLVGRVGRKLGLVKDDERQVFHNFAGFGYTLDPQPAFARAGLVSPEELTEVWDYTNQNRVHIRLDIARGMVECTLPGKDPKVASFTLTEFTIFKMLMGDPGTFFHQDTLKGRKSGRLGKHFYNMRNKLGDEILFMEDQRRNVVSSVFESKGAFHRLVA